MWFEGCVALICRWSADYERIAFPDLTSWRDVMMALAGGELVSDATVGNLAERSTIGSRWNPAALPPGGAKPTAVKRSGGRNLGEQLKKQWEKLPISLRLHVDKCREAIVRCRTIGMVADSEVEISITGSHGETTSAYFYRADLGMKEECTSIIAKHKETVKAFLIHLTKEDKVDKAQFSICMGVIRELAVSDAFVVQVFLSILMQWNIFCCMTSINIGFLL